MNSKPSRRLVMVTVLVMLAVALAGLARLVAPSAHHVPDEVTAPLAGPTAGAQRPFGRPVTSRVAVAAEPWSVIGTVLFEDGTPADRARVILLDHHRRAFAETTCDRDGHARLEGASRPVRPFRLTVCHPDASWWEVDGLTPAWLESGGFGVVDLRRGEPLAGRFVDAETGRGVPGVTLLRGSLEGPATEQALSDDEGRWTLRGASRGDVLSWTHPAYARGHHRLEALTASTPWRLHAPRPLGVRVVDDRGLAVPDVRVQADRVGAHPSVHVTGWTDPTGCVAWDDLAAGYYRLRAHHPEAAPASVARAHTDVADVPIRLTWRGSARVHLEGIDEGTRVHVRALTTRGPTDDHWAVCGEQGVVVVHGLELQALHLELRVAGRGTWTTPTFQPTAGHMADVGRARPVEGVHCLGRLDGPVPPGTRVAVGPVAERAKSLPPVSLFEVPSARRTAVQEDGTWSFGAVQHGRRALEVDAPGYVAWRQWIEPEEPLTLPALVVAGIVRGVVLRDGQPLADAEVSVARGAFSRRSTTGRDGRFILRDVPPGVQRLVASPPQDAGALLLSPSAATSREVTVDVRAGASIEVTLRVH